MVQDRLQEGVSGCAGSPDVEEHQHQRADDDSLEDLPVAAQVGHHGHQQLAPQGQEAGHHVHGEPPLRQADLDPWKSEQLVVYAAFHLAHNAHW